MSVFGILPSLEIHSGMWPGYVFSRFHEHVFPFVGFKSFLAFCPFRNARKHEIRLYIFLVFMSVFGILPIFEMHLEACGPVIFFFVFMRDLKTSYQSKFQKRCPTKMK